MRFKRAWIPAVLAILGMVNSASADITYSVSEVVTSGSLTGAAGTSVTVQLYLNETVTGNSTSIVAAQGIASYALGINSSTGGTATISSVTPATYGAGTSMTYTTGTNNTSAGNNGFIDAAGIAGSGVFSPGTGLQSSGSQNGSSAASTSGIYLGQVQISIGAGQTTYTISTAYAGSAAFTDGAPNVFTGFNDQTFAGGNNLWAGGVDPDSGQTYTGAGDNGPVTFVVGTAAVPEPSSMVLCGMLVVGGAYSAYRRRKNQPVTVATVATVA